MGEPTLSAKAEGLISRGLANHLLERNVITRIGPDDLFHEGETDGIDIPTWDKAVNKLVDAGRILVYRITDLPDTLPLAAAYQTGYTTREHLLGLLKKATPSQVEEIRDFLEYEGVEIPASAVPVPVTAAQKSGSTTLSGNSMKSGTRSQTAIPTTGSPGTWTPRGTST